MAIATATTTSATVACVRVCQYVVETAAIVTPSAIMPTAKRTRVAWRSPGRYPGPSKTATAAASSSIRPRPCVRATL